MSNNGDNLKNGMSRNISCLPESLSLSLPFQIINATKTKWNLSRNQRARTGFTVALEIFFRTNRKKTMSKKNAEDKNIIQITSTG